MNKTDNDLQNIANHISLSEQEKGDLWASIQKNKVVVTKPIPTPFFHFLSTPSFHLASAFSVVIIGFFSLSALAEQSIPGSPLYAVKINVNETIQESLAWGDEAKARTHIEISKDRIEDIKKAATLQETSEEELNVAIDSLEDHSDEAIESIKKVSRGKEKERIQTSLMLSTQLNDTLEAYNEEDEEESKDINLFATSPAETEDETEPTREPMMMRAKMVSEEPTTEDKPEEKIERSEREEQLEEIEELIEAKKNLIREYLEELQ